MGIDITPGEHLQRHLFGLTIDMDIVWATVIAGLIVITLGLILRSKATSGVPGKFQMAWELLVGAVQKQVDDSIGPRGASVVPLALTLFIFIFTCNLFEVLGHRLRSSTGCPPRPATSTCPWPWPSTSSSWSTGPPSGTAGWAATSSTTSPSRSR